MLQMVPPRGCAYIVMEKRKDAYKTIERLKGQKMNGSTLKVKFTLFKLFLTVLLAWLLENES